MKNAEALLLLIAIGAWLVLLAVAGSIATATAAAAILHGICYLLEAVTKLF